MVVLLGFDDPCRAALSSGLRGRGIQVSCYASPQAYIANPGQPINAAFERRALVIDLSGLPEDALAQLTELGQPADLIIVTAPEQSQLRLAALRNGYWKQCQKPVQLDELRGLIDLKSQALDFRVRAGYSNERISLPQALYEYQREHEALNEHAIVSVSDQAGQIIYVNDLFCSISGYSRDELLGQNHRIVKSSAHPASFYRQMWATISGGQVWNGVICNRRKDGSPYWVESTITPFMDGDGHPYQYVSIRTDITDVIQAQERLRRGQIYANIGTWEWSIQTGELFWSDRIPTLFGYQEGELETTYENFINTVHPDDRLMLEDAIQRCLEQDAPYDIEHRVIWPDGTVRWLQETGAVVRDDQDRPRQMIGIVQDIDERKRDRIALARRQRELNEAQALAHLGNWSSNLETGELFWSDEIYRIFGYLPGEITPSIDFFRQHVHPDDQDILVQSETNAAHTGFHDVTHRIQRPSGEIRHIHELAIAEYNAEGKMVRLTGTVQDVTERVLADQQLRETEARFAFAVEGAGDGVWDLNLITRQISLSRPGLAMLGYEPGEMPRDFDDWNASIHPDDSALVSSELEEYLNGNRETYCVERRQRTKSGEYRWILCRGTAIERDGNGRPTQMIGINSDIHERKLEQQALIHAREEAESANRAKSEFLSSMSHELRTPMNAILGFAQLLEYDDSLNADQIDSVQEIGRAGRHLLSLINEVLDLAKVESGHLELSLETVDLHSVVQESLALLDPIAARNAIQIEVDELSTLQVHADRIRMKQVLLNLLSNAIKYNRPRGKINISAGYEGRHLRCVVTDTGLGIPEGKQSRLFEPFSRLHVEHVEIEGTGIGLTLTKRLIEAMGGQIGVQSTPEQGTSFWFTLPRDEQHSTGTLAPDAPMSTTAAAAQTQATALYVDDNPANLKLLRQLIGCFLPSLSLYTTESPATGLALALELQPDLILLDISMPELDGHQLLKQLRDEHQVKAPIVAISANAMLGDIDRGLANGFNDYLTKPLDVQRTLDVLTRQLGLAALSHPASLAQGLNHV